MTTRPLVLVSTDVRSLDGYTWHAAIDTYLRSAFQVAGVTPLLVPSFGEAVFDEGLLNIAHGVLLTGARSNVHPERYGQIATPDHEPFDPDRDSTTLPLVTKALDAGLPLLAICRGHQELNTALGGTIDAEIQTLDGREDHRGGAPTDPIEHKFRPNHTITLTPGGRLASILGVESIMVNSVHRQAIGTLAPGLQVEATAPDGTIEAVSARDAAGFSLGVQWHPEYWASQSAEDDAPSTKIFQAFGDAARAFQAAR